MSSFEWDDKEHALLSWTTAMDCYSWSLPAKLSCPAAVARNPEDICYACYAQLGAYNYPTTLAAQAARFAWLLKCMETAEGRRLWIKTLAAAINSASARNGHFRWHDSGDIFNSAYAKMIRQVVKLTPTIKHWLPTRSWRLKRMLAHLVNVHSEPNANVRPSAIKFGDPPPNIEGLGRGSTSHTDIDNPPAFVCPKTDPDNDGKSCVAAGCNRRCWDARCSVSYYVHGRRGFNGVHHASDKETANRVAMLAQKRAFVPASILETVK